MCVDHPGPGGRRSGNDGAGGRGGRGRGRGAEPGGRGGRLAGEGGAAGADRRHMAMGGHDARLGCRVCRYPMALKPKSLTLKNPTLKPYNLCTVQGSECRVAETSLDHGYGCGPGCEPGCGSGCGPGCGPGGGTGVYRGVEPGMEPGPTSVDDVAVM